MKKRIAPSERIEQELFRGLRESGDPLGEAARRGAQLILQKALEAEVDEFLGRSRYERSSGDGPCGYRNGYEKKKVHTGEGSIELAVPQLRATLEPFESVWLSAIGRRSRRLLELVPLLYVKGMSQRDIESALLEALGVEGTGRTVVNEVCRGLRGDFERWQERDLGVFSVVYLFLDGIYLKLRPEDHGAIAVLCAYGMTWKGEKVLLHLAVGDKESTVCWEAFLEDMKRRGLNDPLLGVIDGNAGVRKAFKRKFPGALVQRCQVHKMRNILSKLPHLARPMLKKLILKAFTAATYEDGLAQARAIIAEYHDAFPAAMKCLEQDVQESLTALKFPFLHRRHIRSTNLLERLFGEGRRRTKVIPRFTSEASGLSLVFAVLVDTSEGWRGVRMKPYIEDRLKQMMVDPDSLWEDPDLKKLAA
jgi:putative transposase